MIIHLRLPLPTAWCGLPADIERAARLHRPFGPLDLAPGGVYQATWVTPCAGGLLHHRFTLTRIAPGGLFSVALSRGLPRVGVTHHLALRSPDFPRRDCSRRDHPANSSAEIVRDRLIKLEGQGTLAATLRESYLGFGKNLDSLDGLWGHQLDNNQIPVERAGDAGRLAIVVRIDPGALGGTRVPLGPFQFFQG